MSLFCLLGTRSGLTLGELELGARALLTVLLALLHARVAREEATFTERLVNRLVRLLEAARDAEANRAGLAGGATAVHLDDHIPLRRGMLATIDKQGWHGVLMQFRGCSGEHNLKDRSYHSGETGDLRFLIETLRKRYPHSILCAVGFSLGGNALLKYLGEYKDNTLLKAALAISVPYLLSNSAAKLEKGFSRIYQRHLLNRLVNKTLSKFKDRQAPVDITNINKWNTFRLFDHYVTASIHGFKSGDDYYEQCSSRQYLIHITIPTLLIHSKDDPFMSEDAIPNQDDLSDSVTLELSDHGGHVGFVSGNIPWNAKYWLEERIPEYLDAFLA